MKGAGGTDGGVAQFFVGLAMAVGGGYLLTQRVTVTSGFWSFFGGHAFGLSLLRLPRHPFHGALKRKPSGIPSAAIIRSQCFSQFQLSFFRRRAGPRLSRRNRSGP